MRPKGEKDPLAQVEQVCQVVKLSTCMRTVYVLNKDALKSEEQQKAYQALISFIERRDMYSASTKFESLEGAKAYEFLLYWIIGGINPNKTFQDSRILGDVREIWTKLCVSPSRRAIELVPLYRSLFNDLFSDSTQLRKLIPIYESLDQNSLVPILKRACVNCSWARIQGFLGCLVNFDYQSFAQGTHLKNLEESLIQIQEKLVPRSKVPEGEEALQSIVAEQQREGIRKRLVEVEQLLVCLAHLKPKLVLDELRGEELIGTDLVLKSEKLAQDLVSTRIVVKPSGAINFFIDLVQQQFDKSPADFSLVLR